MSGQSGGITAEIVTTGTELLLGSTLNTHPQFLGQELAALGVRVARQTTVPDGAPISAALAEAAARSPEIVIVTGGLGPTSDDVTRDELAGLFHLPLRPVPEVLAAIHERCRRRNIAFRDSMAKQALAPGGARTLPNENGTAPGIYLPPQQRAPVTHWFLLPGPPHELIPMWKNHALPLLKSLLPATGIPETRVYRITGMGETAIEEAIGGRIEREGLIEVGYCARPNEVDFRLIGPPEEIKRWHPLIIEATGTNLFCIGAQSMEEVLVQTLRRLGQTLATAESCTGGLLAHRITNVPGASEVFIEGHVTYSNDSKTRILGVPEELIATHGAVSPQTARAMAESLLERSGACHALATTGIAGPGGGTPEKPVGLVFIAHASTNRPTIVIEHHFPTDRETFKRLASQAALDLLRKALA